MFDVIYKHFNTSAAFVLSLLSQQCFLEGANCITAENSHLILCRLMRLAKSIKNYGRNEKYQVHCDNDKVVLKHRDLIPGWKLPLSITWSILLDKEWKNLPGCIPPLFM